MAHPRRRFLPDDRPRLPGRSCHPLREPPFFSDGITPTQTALLSKSLGIPFSGVPMTSLITSAALARRSASRPASAARAEAHKPRHSKISASFRIATSRPFALTSSLEGDLLRLLRLTSRRRPARSLSGRAFRTMRFARLLLGTAPRGFGRRFGGGWRSLGWLEHDNFDRTLHGSARKETCRSPARRVHPRERPPAQEIPRGKFP